MVLLQKAGDLLDLLGTAHFLGGEQIFGSKIFDGTHGFRSP